MCYFERERHCRIYSLVFEGLNCDIELTPALTDFKGPTIFICYRRISVIANIEIKEKFFKGPKGIFCYRRISVTGRAVRAGFNCTLMTHDQLLVVLSCTGVEVRTETNA